MKPQESAIEDWSEVGTLLGDLYRIVHRLEGLFPGRKFTPDGHLVGSMGEALASYMFDLKLLPASAPGHDAITADGNTMVQIKLTQGKSVALRSEPQHLLVLRLDSDLVIEVVYNGCGTAVWRNTGKLGSNGTRTISVAKLRRLNSDVAAADQLTLVKEVDLNS